MGPNPKVVGGRVGDATLEPRPLRVSRGGVEGPLELITLEIHCGAVAKGALGLPARNHRVKEQNLEGYGRPTDLDRLVHTVVPRRVRPPRVGVCCIRKLCCHVALVVMVSGDRVKRDALERVGGIDVLERLLEAVLTIGTVLWGVNARAIEVVTQCQNKVWLERLGNIAHPFSSGVLPFVVVAPVTDGEEVVRVVSRASGGNRRCRYCCKTQHCLVPAGS
mmetsp:Transcript_21506/g.56068  ORF Transcript_21506/g.56068 Transcript_21506/m.56068 type:complete len:220 (+) Transcript_21506:888-1547(+)